MRGRSWLGAALAALAILAAACGAQPANPASPAPRTNTPETARAAAATAPSQSSPSASPSTAETSAAATPDPPERATSPPPPTAAPTPTPTPSPMNAVARSKFREAARLIRNVAGSSDALRAGPDLAAILEEAVRTVLERRGVDAGSAALLEAAVADLPPHVYDVVPKGARIAAADVDGDAQQELIAAFNILGVPPLWFDGAGGKFTARPFPTAAASGEESSMAAVHSVADWTGDGVADALLVSTTTGAGALTETLRVYVWEAAPPAPAAAETPALPTADEPAVIGPRRVFDVTVDYWAAPAGWRARSASARPAIEVTCAVLGSFDAQLLPHPGLLRIFAWDGAWFAEIARRVDAPVSLHDQVNRGEAAFWAGDYAAAAAAYQAVIAAPVPAQPGHDTTTDWEGVARLRLVQLTLLAGGVPETEALRAVAERGGAIGLIGQAIQAAFQHDDPLQAFAALQRANLNAPPPPGSRGSLGPVADPALTLALGKAVELALREIQPQALTADAIVRALESRGVQVRAAAVGDLDGDEIPEAVVSLPRNSARIVGPPANDFWFVRRAAQRWAVQPVQRVGLAAVTNGTATIDERRAVFELVEPGLGPERTRYLSFDGRQTTIWLRPPTADDLDPPNPFDGQDVRRCELDTETSGTTPA